MIQPLQRSQNGCQFGYLFNHRNIRRHAHFIIFGQNRAIGEERCLTTCDLTTRCRCGRDSLSCSGGRAGADADREAAAAPPRSHANWPTTRAVAAAAAAAGGGLEIPESLLDRLFTPF
jgi:hypothetical protein